MYKSKGFNISKYEKIIEISVLMYFITIFFYGLLIKLTFNHSFLFNVKTILPEFFLIVIIITILIRVIKEGIYIKSTNITIFTGYIIIIMVMNLHSLPNTREINLFIRDILIPILVSFSIYQANLSKNTIRKITVNLFKISICFVIIGFILAIIQYINGFEWSSKFYTGYSFYGFDEVSKIKINNTLSGKFRVPSVTGSSATFGFYNILAIILLLNIGKKNIFKMIMLGMAVTNIILSTNKTALILFLVVLGVYLAKDIPKNLKVAIGCIFFSFIIIYILILIKNDSGIFFSLKERMNFWISIFKDNFNYKVIIPLNLYSFSAGGEGFTSVWDNTFLYVLFALGPIGFILIIMNIIISYSKAKQSDYKNIIIYLIIVFVIGSFTTNLTNGRCFFSIYLILIPLLLNDKLKKLQ